MSVDFPLSLTDTDVNEHEHEQDYDLYNFTFSDTTLTTSDFCDIPEPPNPEFTLPDTVCLQSKVEANNLYNHFAHGIEWQISGVAMDSTWQDSLHFEHCFEQAGDFWVTQTIWFLGCDHSLPKK